MTSQNLGYEISEIHFGKTEHSKRIQLNPFNFNGQRDKLIGLSF